MGEHAIPDVGWCEKCGKLRRYVVDTANHGLWCGKCIKALRREEALALKAMKSADEARKAGRAALKEKANADAGNS